ncbi:hypothetical protein PFJ02_23380 [Mycobacterium xenopi]|uniref:DUF402 domain-containing protein n=5 Tax=Mycobacterium TaxID=1763 RepID=A0AAW5SAN5_MYCBC|nr:MULTISPECIES: hypothetical protein [Mycobacterium]MCV6991782.1 hypothetical protein [Mycobacterium bouchedurhonense]MCV6996706.1 hypothetical protein [Mycobacterium timonense]MDA3642291.1 hypothetical protein [Mycobacterium xenopi]MDA3664912.1 hypothetical protein [Mycobacterium xenopi]SPX88405.1 Uncharacterised protein [Mycobacterium xenopi]
MRNRRFWQRFTSRAASKVEQTHPHTNTADERTPNQHARSVENTSRRPAADHLAGLMASDSYGPDMETAGQAQLVASELLPAAGDWAALERFGFIKKTPVAEDNLFVEAILPEGWRRERDDHPMWSKVLDTRGLPRVSIFYKAAFYDRDAFFTLVDVGAEIVGEVIVDDAPVVIPAEWSLLTKEERTQGRRHAQRLASDDWDEHKQRRAQELLELLAQAEPE